MSKAIEDVIAERHRQVAGEGFDAAHDDCHDDGHLARAGASYALAAITPSGALERAKRDMLDPNYYPGGSMIVDLWPWEPEWFKPKNRRRDLVRAAALILAEIERLDRAGATK